MINNRKKPELLIPASSLEVLKLQLHLVQTRYISVVKLLGFAQKQKISAMKIWHWEYNLRILMELRFM